MTSRKLFDGLFNSDQLCAARAFPAIIQPRRPANSNKSSNVLTVSKTCTRGFVGRVF
jgi:hypothetical protein